MKVNERLLKFMTELVDETEMAIYMDGYNRILPVEWEKHLLEYQKKTDPEYKQFMRLKKKFESKDS